MTGQTATPAMAMQLTPATAPTHVRGEHWKTDAPRGFRNPWPSAKAEQSFPEVVKFLWDGLGKKQPELADGRASFVPRAEVDFTPPPEGERAKATWLGHACVLVQLAPLPGAKRGLHALYDPVFSDRCGPSQLFGAPKRFTPVPCGDGVAGGVAGLPEIDVVVISHNHYDHLDLPTLKALYAKQAAAPPALLCPLNTTRVLRGAVPDQFMRELDWWEEVAIASPHGDATFTCTPAQHMTARTTWDLAQSLWASFALRAKRDNSDVTVWFGGDTGYSAVDTETHDIDPARPVCPAFAEIGRRLGPIDLAFIPIGAYAARPFLSTVHCAPIDAARIFKDIQARRAVAIHWGTWDLSHEPVSEPPRLLAEARSVVGLTKDEFDICPLGGSVTV